MLNESKLAHNFWTDKTCSRTYNVAGGGKVVDYKCEGDECKCLQSKCTRYYSTYDFKQYN